MTDHQTYTKETLEELFVEDIVPIFNHFSEKLGEEIVGSFDSKEEAIFKTLSIIEKFEDKEHKQQITKSAVKALLPTEPKKITQSLHRTITIVSRPDETQFNKRFDLYKDGMSILDVMRTEGLCRADVYAYVKQGNFVLSELPITQPAVKASKKISKSEENSQETAEELNPEDLVG